MLQHLDFEGTDRGSKGHLTTRRGFVTVLSFGVATLYGLWAAYGAAPTSLGMISGKSGGGMEGMGHGGGGGPSPDEFRRLTERFVEANGLPDGSVKPAVPGEAGLPEATDHGTSPMVGTAEKEGGEHHERGGAVDVYLMASRYGYDPSVLRLEPNVPYRFKMMAVDANHGASINVRMAGRMIRCPARTLVEREMTFTRPGEYLMYCTVYCGEGHDMMMGKILVA